ncbi:MAG TPA: PfkB family carbohydrate kinase, partial [Ktedonobacteraceae bacterium]|nr:PfkB family carbohydrate kinase [Ktedonobacteraceae bacterium]
TTHDRAILTAPEAMAKFSIQQVRLDLLARARHLHLSSYFLQSALQPHVPQLLAQARALGLSTSVDPGFDPAERWQIPGLLQELDFFFPNEVEACAITGETDVRAALEVLAGQTPTVAIKCGAQGTLAAHRNERIHIPAFTVEAVDTTGAGDAFDAGFLAAALAGEDLTTCVRSGNACGALTAAHRGGSGGFTRATVDALLKHQEKGAQYSS